MRESSKKKASRFLFPRRRAGFFCLGEHLYFDKRKYKDAPESFEEVVLAKEISLRGFSGKVMLIPVG